MKKIKVLVWLLSISLILIHIPFDELFAQRGRSSFGGSRSFSRSFGGTRSFGGVRSFGGTRAYSLPGTSPKINSPLRNKSFSIPRARSFGGTVSSMLNRSSIASKYGVPRKVITSREFPNLPRNVVVNHYGDFASGLMMGYLMGHTSWLWYLPFHPAFYYTQPVQVVNPDGTISYYPPTFDFGKFVMTLIILGSIGFIVLRVIRRRRIQYRYRNLSGMDFSKSSFSI